MPQPKKSARTRRLVVQTLKKLSVFESMRVASTTRMSTVAPRTVVRQFRMGKKNDKWLRTWQDMEGECDPAKLGRILVQR